MSNTATPSNSVQETSQTPAGEQQPQIFDGKYKVIRRIADDDLSEYNSGIFIVEDLETHQTLICKQLKPGTGKHESEILAKVSPHPNVTQYIDSKLHPADSSSNDRIYMEYCNAGSLRDYLKEHNGEKIPEAFALSIFRDLTAAVKHLQNGPPGVKNWDSILHRDIKPINVFLMTVGRTPEEYPRAVLGDFGCAFTHSELDEILLDYENCDDPGLPHDVVWADPEDDMSFTHSAEVYQIAGVIKRVCGGGLFNLMTWTKSEMECSDELKELVRRCMSEDFSERLDVWDLEKELRKFGAGEEKQDAGKAE